MVNAVDGIGYASWTETECAGGLRLHPRRRDRHQKLGQQRQSG